MNPGEGGNMEAEYHSFLQELGGGAVPEGIKAPRAGLGMHRNSRDLPDNCKLYVGNLPNTFDDARLSELFEQFGPLVHCMVMKVRADDDGRAGANCVYGNDYGNAVVYAWFDSRTALS